MPQDPPNQRQTLAEILPDALKTNANGWKNKYGGITRGDLMRLSGFAPIADTRDPAHKHPVPGLGPYYKPKRDPADPDPPANAGNGCLSGILSDLNNQDMVNLSRILEKYNGMSYGTSVYFCCSCV